MCVSLFRSSQEAIEILLKLITYEIRESIHQQLTQKFNVIMKQFMTEITTIQNLFNVMIKFIKVVILLICFFLMIFHYRNIKIAHLYYTIILLLLVQFTGLDLLIRNSINLLCYLRKFQN